MLTDNVNAATKREWQELGFFYESDDAGREWRMVGSKNGLLRFAELLWKYSENPGNKKISEHNHYGPYMYLKIMTWTEPLITKSDIRGTLLDFGKLADLISSKIKSSRPGEILVIDKEYSQKNEFVLKLFVKEHGFDPAKADPALPK